MFYQFLPLCVRIPTEPEINNIDSNVPTISQPLTPTNDDPSPPIYTNQTQEDTRSQISDTNYTSLAGDDNTTLHGTGTISDLDADENYLNDTQNRLINDLAQRAQTQKELFLVQRKIVRGAKNSKSPSRTWVQLYCVLSDSQLMFFKDQNSAAKAVSKGAGQIASAGKNLTYKSELPLDLKNGSCYVAKDYTKRPNVFRLTAANGAEFLMQVGSSQDMNSVVAKLQGATGQSLGFGPVASATQNVSEQSQSSPKKRGGFFKSSKK